MAGRRAIQAANIAVVLPHHRRILLLTEGRLGPFTSKTAASLLRYRADDVAGIVDSEHAGRQVRDIIPWSPAAPILPSVQAASKLRADSLYIGIAPVGGDLPLSMRRHVLDALRAGLDVVSGLHAPLGEDAEFASAAAGGNARIFDVRKPPAARHVSTGAARQTRCRRILTVGTDCNVGKMVTALEVVAAGRRRGLRVTFVATGQTGIMIERRGVAIDAVVSDFAGGAVESLVLEAGDADLCVIEGQGSIAHPGYSGVTLSLLHGSCPDAMILVHHAGRTRYSAKPNHPLPDVAALRDLYEQAAGVLHPSRIVAVALNTHGAAGDVAAQERSRLVEVLGVPVADPIADGCEALLEAVL